MPRTSLILGLAVLLFSCSEARVESAPTSCAPPTAAKARALEISGPYVHDNLSVFLLHGEDRLRSSRPVVPLAEAVDSGRATLRETGEVGRVAIVNLTDDCDVFVQAGDVVQGGKQDRAIAVSLLIEPGGDPVLVEAFCVEQGRWSPRGGESAKQFRDARRAVASKRLKIAMQVSRDQGCVWKEVRAYRAQLANQLDGDPGGPPSGTSLAGALERRRVSEETARYIEALAPVTTRRDDVIGFAFAINGRPNSADVYGSRALFVAMWPKLLATAAAEAVAERHPNDSHTDVGIPEIRQMLSAARSAETSRRTVTGRIDRVTRQSCGVFVSEARDRSSECVHRMMFTMF